MLLAALAARGHSRLKGWMVPARRSVLFVSSSRNRKGSKEERMEEADVRSGTHGCCLSDCGWSVAVVAAALRRGGPSRQRGLFVRTELARSKENAKSASRMRRIRLLYSQHSVRPRWTLSCVATLTGGRGTPIMHHVHLELACIRAPVAGYITLLTIPPT